MVKLQNVQFRTTQWFGTAWLARSAGMTLLACLLSLGTGCGESDAKKPPTIKVRGTITLKGKPITGGVVTFAPVGGGNRRAGTGPIQTDGSFVISSFQAGDGVEAGEYKVFINPPPAPPDSKNAAAKSDIPAKYTSLKTSPLTEKINPTDSSKSVEYKLE